MTGQESKDKFSKEFERITGCPVTAISFNQKLRGKVTATHYFSALQFDNNKTAQEIVALLNAIGKETIESFRIATVATEVRNNYHLDDPSIKINPATVIIDPLSEEQQQAFFAVLNREKQAINAILSGKTFVEAKKQEALASADVTSEKVTKTGGSFSVEGIKHLHVASVQKTITSIYPDADFTYPEASWPYPQNYTRFSVTMGGYSYGKDYNRFKDDLAEFKGLLAKEQPLAKHTEISWQKGTKEHEHHFEPAPQKIVITNTDNTVHTYELVGGGYGLDRRAPDNYKIGGGYKCLTVDSQGNKRHTPDKKYIWDIKDNLFKAITEGTVTEHHRVDPRTLPHEPYYPHMYEPNLFGLSARIDAIGSITPFYSQILGDVKVGNVSVMLDEKTQAMKAAWIDFSVNGQHYRTTVAVDQTKEHAGIYVRNVKGPQYHEPFTYNELALNEENKRSAATLIIDAITLAEGNIRVLYGNKEEVAQEAHESQDGGTIMTDKKKLSNQLLENAGKSGLKTGSLNMDNKTHGLLVNMRDVSEVAFPLSSQKSEQNPPQTITSPR